MKNNYTIALISTVALSFIISSCSPLKPDHPQQFSNFKDRRTPRDNQVASRGTLSEDQKKSGFTPYTGPIPTAVDKTDTSVSTNDKTTVKTDSVPPIQGSDKSTTDKTTDTDSVLDRLIKKLSLNNFETPQQFASLDQRRAPKQNYIDEDVNGQFGQGSSAGANYYDIADEISLSAPVKQVVKVAANSESSNQNPNPSASLVEVPEIPSIEKVKQQSAQISDKPELSQVPPKPQQFQKPIESVQQVDEKPILEKSVISVKKKMVKANKKKKPLVKTSNINRHLTAYNYFDDKIDIKEIVIKDKAATIQYEHGHPIVSGELVANRNNKY